MKGINIDMLNNLKDISSEDLSITLSSIKEQYQLTDILSYIINTPKALEEIASISYHHNNNFDKIVLSLDSHYSLRLHIWWGIYLNDLYIEDIHNHGWNFCTNLLCGEYEYEEFEEISSGIGSNYLHYKYLAKFNESFYELKYLGKKNLKIINAGILKRNDTLHRSHHVLHRVKMTPNLITASLFLSGNSKGSSDIYKLSNTNNQTMKNIETFKPSDLKFKLENILKHI